MRTPLLAAGLVASLCGTSLADTTAENVAKYWSLRQRLDADFVRVGPEQGRSQPSTERMDDLHLMKWGDSTASTRCCCTTSTRSRRHSPGMPPATMPSHAPRCPRAMSHQVSGPTRARAVAATASIPTTMVRPAAAAARARATSRMCGCSLRWSLVCVCAVAIVRARRPSPTPVRSTTRSTCPSRPREGPVLRVRALLGLRDLRVLEPVHEPCRLYSRNQ